MNAHDDPPVSKPHGFAKLQQHIASPCKILFSRCLRPIKKRKKLSPSSGSGVCNYQQSTIHVVQPSATDEPETHTESCAPSGLPKENDNTVSPDPNDGQEQCAATSNSDGHNRQAGSPSSPPVLDFSTQAADGERDNDGEDDGKKVNGDKDEDENENEMIPSREVSFLLRNAEFNRERDIQELEEAHAAKIALITQEKDGALQVIEELTEERDQLSEACQHWQFKFVEAVAKANKPSQPRGLTASGILGSPAEEDGAPLSSRVDRWLMGCDRNQPGMTGSDDTQEVIEQEVQSGFDHDEKQEESDSLVYPDSSSDDEDSDADPDDPNSYPFANPNPPEARPPNTRTQLANCLKDLEKLSAKEFPDFQLRQDLIETRESKEMLQEQLQSQIAECEYMRGIFSPLMDKIVRLNNESANPTDHLEAAIGEGLVHEANYERVKRTLDKVKKDLKVAKRRKIPRKLRPVRRLKPRFIGRVNLKPYQAELRAHDRLRMEALEQGAIHLNQLRTTVSMLERQAQGDELSLGLADLLRDALDRNEALERDVWNLRHPDTLEYLCLRN